MFLQHCVVTIVTALGLLSSTIASVLPLSVDADHERNQKVKPFSSIHSALRDVVDAIEAMQDTYFDNFAGTWPDAIDWTAAVMGTHISATLSSIVDGLDLSYTESCADTLQWDNIINQYFTQTAFFYFGENTFGLRNQAYDDMLWVVLGWLENIKFTDMYSLRRKNLDQYSHAGTWHGTQFIPMAAHRARIFYELASEGWDTSLCDGGMTWNPSLKPYKNAITNELFMAASIGMYLYFPGDNNTAPFLTSDFEPPFGKPHDPQYLENAVKSYKWLQESHMQNVQGLFQDGFHITGWHRYPNGTVNPGTGRCDEINRMVYTYNQGVMLSASRGLWLATGARSYLDDGHSLVSSVIRATGWPNRDRSWRGLGRAGVLEEWCDHDVHCSQDGQTFKGIFFHHLAEFCRPLRPQERHFVFTRSQAGFDEEGYQYHLALCAAYGKWIDHNARAASITRNDDGLFGMWWGVPWGTRCDDDCMDGMQELPPGAIDHLNPPIENHASISPRDVNDRGRGRTVETQGGGLAALRARWQWQTFYS